LCGLTLHKVFIIETIHAKVGLGHLPHARLQRLETFLERRADTAGSITLAASWQGGETGLESGLKCCVRVALDAYPVGFSFDYDAG
jgi:hypothetical protein